MKIFALVLSSLVLLVVVYFIRLSFLSEKNIESGLHDNQLRACPSSPNCVCSEQGEAASIAPFPFINYENTNNWQRLPNVISQLGGEIHEHGDHYLWATFKTPLFRFVDDVEFRLDEEKNFIHVRSASRVGHSDFGTNRKRVESIRQKLN